MISIEFDRAKMRPLLLKYLAIFFGVTGVSILVASSLLSHVAATGWLKSLVTILMCFVMAQVIEFIQYTAILGRGLRKKTPAVVINHTGIVDNASQFALGQVTWNEIEKMYPWEYKFRLLVNRWSKMPVIFRQRGVVVILKDDADLQHLIKNKPWIIRSLSQEWYRPSKRRGVFIPEMVLPVTANELMEKLNKFYVTQVRGY